MERNDTSSAMSFLAGAILGGAIGAMAALLLAPRTGAETREVLKKKAKELGKDLDQFKRDMQPKIDNFRKNLVKKVDIK